MSKATQRSEVNEEMESLTIHGISKVTSAKNRYVRLIWLVLCLSAATTLGVTAVKSVLKYLEYHSIVESNSKYHDKMALPAITFCHSNYFHPLSYVEKEPPVVQHFPENCNLIDDKYFKNEMNKLIFQFTCKMFIGHFDAKTLGMNMDIPEFFRFPKGFQISPNIMPCVTLNANSTLVQLAAGERYGLHMILYNNLFEGTSLGPVYNPLTDSRNGIYVILHDPEQKVTMVDGIIAPPGFHTHISITKKSFKRLPYPYPSKCTNRDSDPNSFYPGKNTQIMCYVSCSIRQLYEMCPGVIPQLKVFMKAPEFPIPANLSNKAFIRCIISNLSRIDNDKCNCSPNCNEVAYTAISDRNPWPQKWQAQSFLKLLNKVEGVKDRNLSTEEIRDRLIRVSIYYPYFIEEIFSDKPMYDLSSIASDLGGQMGLFLGASLLSLAEIIALVATSIRRRFGGVNQVIKVSIKPTT